jgi:peptide deformylase
MICTDLKVLRQVSKPFNGSQKELNQLISLLEKALVESPIPGVGLSAIQIGIPLQVAIIRTLDLQLDLYNTEIIKMNGPFIFNNEGCLSIPNVFKDTTRFKIIQIKNGDGSIINLEYYNSVVAQHEIDHFSGFLFIDRTI